MLREQRRRKQQVADKIGHEEYIYKLNGDAFSGQEDIRVRQQGDFDPRAAAGNGNNNNGGRRGAGNARPSVQLNPITGQPSGAAGGNGGPDNNNNNRNAGAALVPYADNSPNGPYASPYGAPAAYAGNHGSPAPYYGGGPQSFVPAMPPMAPLSDLPGPLPPVYRPKPPLTFHGNGSPSAGPALYVPDGYNMGNPYAAGWPAAPMPNYGGGREDGARPSTSPTVLPPLTPRRGGGDNGGGGGGGRSPRPSTGGGGAGGGFVVGSSGLSDLEDRHKEKMAARQRAIDLQQENARQMLEQQQRKQAEREREMQADRFAEDRLRREREEVARRGQAEVDRERKEREMKMMGPRAAQEMLEQQRKETEERREAEAAARRNRGRNPQQQQQQQLTTPEKAEGGSETAAPASTPAKETEASTNSSEANASAQPQLLPLNQRPPVSFTSGLTQPPPQLPQMQTPGMHTTQQYFANIGLGGAGLSPPPRSSSPGSDPYYAPFMLQRQQRIRLEGDVIHEELRHIALLLEAQQLNNAIAHKTPPPSQWGIGAPPPMSAGGAGTFLTTGMPSPLYPQQSGSPAAGGGGGGYRGSPHPPSSSHSYSSSLSSNAHNAYRPFMAGGAMPPPPLATAAPQHTSPPPLGSSPPYSAAAFMAGGQGGPWPGLFAAPNQPGSNANDNASGTPAGGGAAGVNMSGFLSSYRGDGADSEELAIEPSCFVMPATAPPPPFVQPPLFPPQQQQQQQYPPRQHHGPSASSSLGDVGDATHAGPVERPGTGKPAERSTQPPPLPPPPLPTQLPPTPPTPPTPEASAVAPAKATASRHAPRDSPKAPPVDTASLHRELSPPPPPPPPPSDALGDSPVRGATSHLTSTEVVDGDQLPGRRSPHGPEASPRPPRPRGGAAMEPPVVVLTPRSKEM